MKINLIKWIAKMLVNVMPGGKTKLLIIISYIIGAYNIIIETEILKAICNTYNWCIEGSQAWGSIVMIMGLLMDIFAKSKEIRAERLITEDEYKNLKENKIL